MTNEHDQEDEETEGAKPFPDELIDQLLAQVQNKDAESILGESGLAGQLKTAGRIARPWQRRSKPIYQAATA